MLIKNYYSFTLLRYSPQHDNPRLLTYITHLLITVPHLAWRLPNRLLYRVLQSMHPHRMYNRHIRQKQRLLSLFRPPLEYIITCSTHMCKQFHTLELAMLQLYIFIVNLLIPENTKVL